MSEESLSKVRFTYGGSDTLFRKSSHSGAEGCCVEVAVTVDEILVRDSKVSRHGSAPTLSFTKPEWQAFLLGVKSGEFDLD